MRLGCVVGRGCETTRANLHLWPALHAFPTNSRGGGCGGYVVGPSPPPATLSLQSFAGSGLPRDGMFALPGRGLVLLQLEACRATRSIEAKSPLSAETAMGPGSASSAPAPLLLARSRETAVSSSSSAAEGPSLGPPEAASPSKAAHDAASSDQKSPRRSPNCEQAVPLAHWPRPGGLSRPPRESEHSTCPRAAMSRQAKKTAWVWCRPLRSPAFGGARAAV